MADLLTKALVIKKHKDMKEAKDELHRIAAMRAAKNFEINESYLPLAA
jgi:hypothetical protein